LQDHVPRVVIKLYPGNAELFILFVNGALSHQLVLRNADFLPLFAAVSQREVLETLPTEVNLLKATHPVAIELEL
jgi:hypothetical protein